MSSISKTNTYITGDTVTATKYDEDRDDIINVVNGDIDNVNIAAGANIAYSKLNLTGSIVNADVSSSAAIAVSKINTGISGSLVGDTDTQTLTNKTLTSPTINNPTMKGAHEPWVNASDGGTITFDLSNGNKQRVTLGGDRTLALSNVQNGHVFAIRLKQDATGSRKVTWFSTINWAGGSEPVLTTTASKADLFGFVQTASNTYDGLVLGKNI